MATYQKENAVDIGLLPPWPLSSGLLSGRRVSLQCALPSSFFDYGAQGVVSLVCDGSKLSEFLFQ